MKKRTNPKNMEAVYNALGIGKENAKSRNRLSRDIRIGDRQVREAIEALRHDRPILNGIRGEGYYIPSNDAQGREEAAEWIAGQNRRLRSMKAAQKGAAEFVKAGKEQSDDIPGQLSIFGIGGM